MFDLFITDRRTDIKLPLCKFAEKASLRSLFSSIMVALSCSR